MVSPAEAAAVAGAVTDPELPVLTLADLGVLRSVTTTATGAVVVTLRPTYSGCPAVQAMRDDVRDALLRGGATEVDVRMVLAPAWTSDDITAEGRAKLAAAGIAPPTGGPRTGPIDLRLTRTAPPCPLCGSADTELLSAFGSTACRSLHRCLSCREPFEGIKERHG